MTQKAIGPTFFAEIVAAGLNSLPFSWSADGTLVFGSDMSAAQISSVEAVYAAHDPSAVPLAEQAKAAMVGGLAIVSTATPALNGTYAVDRLSQMDVIAIETSLSAGKGFPGGAATFNYPDASGAMHSFSEANFTDFAAAVRDFVYGCNAVIAGSSTTLPASTVTIA